MKSLILKTIICAGLLFAGMSCVTEKCPANNNGYIQLLRPHAKTAPATLTKGTPGRSHEKNI